MYQERKIKNSELFQIILLNVLYSLSGSEKIYFQGGTALRWIYGGMRFSEDLDFVTNLESENLDRILKGVYQKAQNACIAQFGPGLLELDNKKSRRQAVKAFFIYRPDLWRERIAVKVEFEILRETCKPDIQKIVFRDLGTISAMIAEGKLIFPYSSSIVQAETAEEILTDKIRAVFERTYLKGRDIYDIWYLRKKLNAKTTIERVKAKLRMYHAEFVPARRADFFIKGIRAQLEIQEALETDLPRFLPRHIYSVYQENKFQEFANALKELSIELLEQGLKKLFNEYERRKDNL